MAGPGRSCGRRRTSWRSRTCWSSGACRGIGACRRIQMGLIPLLPAKVLRSASGCLGGVREGADVGVGIDSAVSLPELIFAPRRQARSRTVFLLLKGDQAEMGGGIECRACGEVFVEMLFVRGKDVVVVQELVAENDTAWEVV